jgi:hypothetical protein
MQNVQEYFFSDIYKSYNLKLQNITKKYKTSYISNNYNISTLILYTRNFWINLGQTKLPSVPPALATINKMQELE